MLNETVPSAKRTPTKCTKMLDESHWIYLCACNSPHFGRLSNLVCQENARMQLHSKRLHMQYTRWIKLLSRLYTTPTFMTWLGSALSWITLQMRPGQYTKHFMLRSWGWQCLECQWTVTVTRACCRYQLLISSIRIHRTPSWHRAASSLQAQRGSSSLWRKRKRSTQCGQSEATLPTLVA